MSICRRKWPTLYLLLASTLGLVSAAQAAVPEGLYAASYNRISRKGSLRLGTGDDWSYVSDAKNVSAMTMHNGELYVTSYGTLWRCGALGSPSTPAIAQFSKVGEAYDVVAMASMLGNLYAVSREGLWMRGAIGPNSGNAWTHVGDAFKVTAMAAHRNVLYVTSNNGLWKRGAIGPGTGNSWVRVGDAINVTAMASDGSYLYATANGSLWRRGDLTPTSGNDWVRIGPAANVASLAWISPTNKLATASVWSPSLLLRTGNRIGILARRAWDGNKLVDIPPAFVAVRNFEQGITNRVVLGLIADSNLLSEDQVYTVTVLPSSPGEQSASGTPNLQKLLLQTSRGAYIGTEAATLRADKSQADAEVFIYRPSDGTLTGRDIPYWSVGDRSAAGYPTAKLCASINPPFPQYYTIMGLNVVPRPPQPECLATLYILQ